MESLELKGGWGGRQLYVLVSAVALKLPSKVHVGLSVRKRSTFEHLLYAPTNFGTSHFRGAVETNQRGLAPCDPQGCSVLHSFVSLPINLPPTLASAVNRLQSPVGVEKRTLSRRG